MRQETASELTDDCDCSVQYLAKMIAYSVSQTASHSYSALYVSREVVPSAATLPYFLISAVRPFCSQKMGVNEEAARFLA